LPNIINIKYLPSSHIKLLIINFIKIGSIINILYTNYFGYKHIRFYAKIININCYSYNTWFYECVVLDIPDNNIELIGMPFRIYLRCMTIPEGINIYPALHPDRDICGDITILHNGSSVINRQLIKISDKFKSLYNSRYTQLGNNILEHIMKFLYLDFSTSKLVIIETIPRQITIKMFNLKKFLYLHKQKINQ